LHGPALFIELQGTAHERFGIDISFGKALFGFLALCSQERQFQHGS
jgi:hypothetical protein